LRSAGRRPTRLETAAEEYRRSVTDGIIRIPEPVGDAACWLGRVCPECGALDESPEPAELCPRCGAEMPEAGA
jgi:rubrerythrin